MMASTFIFACMKFKECKRKIISSLEWCFEDDYVPTYLRQIETVTAENLVQVFTNLKRFDLTHKANVNNGCPRQCREALGKFELVSDIKLGKVFGMVSIVCVINKLELPELTQDGIVAPCVLAIQLTSVGVADG